MLVTIIIPIYGNIELLNDSLSSALRQTYKKCEILIVDDGSKQKIKIKKIIKKYESKNSKRIKLISYKKNRGVAHALNRGISSANGDFIAWLSHDDIFINSKIEKQILMFKNKKIQIVSSNYIEWNVSNNYFLNRCLKNNYFKDTLKSLLTNDKLHGCSLVLRKKCFNKIGLFDESLKHTQDYDMWIRLSKKFKFYHLNEALLISRNHSNQSSKLNVSESLKEKVNLFSRYSDNINLTLLEKFIFLMKKFKRKII